MTKLFKWILAIIVFLALLSVVATLLKKTKPQPTATSAGTITILWAEWRPADYLQELCREFTRETGIEVIVKRVPWNDFQTVFFNEMAQRGRSYDMVGGDSQWLGEGSYQGHYVELTKWIHDRGVDKTMTEASMAGYSQYPKGSDHYWAVPLEGDAMGFAYRKDLFEDPQEKMIFAAQYGYDLAIPSTWQQLKDIAAFFYRPQQDFYGLTVWCEKDYDGITMGVDTLIWAFGADLGNHKTFRVKGMLDTIEGAQALKFYKQLYGYSSPEWKNAYLDANNALIQGKVAMVMSYFAFFPDLLDPEKNPYAEVTGFFANPSGSKLRVSSLGGQGLSVVSYSKKKDLCFKFLNWFIEADTQAQWAKLGGYTCNKKILQSEEFLRSNPYNQAFTESMKIVKDFWVVPEYAELLKVSQEYWYKYITTDTITAEEAMYKIADEWEKIFEYAGYYKE